MCVSMHFCGALQVVHYTIERMVQTVLFVHQYSHVTVIRFSSVRWDKAVQELMWVGGTCTLCSATSPFSLILCSIDINHYAQSHYACKQ